MFDYNNLVHIKQDTVCDIGPWVWINTDIHAWVGPKLDWELGHSLKIPVFVKRFRTVVQAGGCMGMYPRMLSDMFDVVYTFEPDPLNFHCLVANCQKNNIIKINAALGEVHKMIEAYHLPSEPNNSGTHRVDVISNNPIIPQLRIDDLNLKYCDLIMLDVEGYEKNVILGAHQTLLDHSPVIIAEAGLSDISSSVSTYGYVLAGNSGPDRVYVKA